MTNIINGGYRLPGHRLSRLRSPFQGRRLTIHRRQPKRGPVPPRLVAIRIPQRIAIRYVYDADRRRPVR